MKNSELLSVKLKRAVKTGEIPYQANRRALKTLDIQGDGKKGLREVDLMLAGLGMFIEDLEELKNASGGVAKRAVAALR